MDELDTNIQDIQNEEDLQNEIEKFKNEKLTTPNDISQLNMLEERQKEIENKTNLPQQPIVSEEMVINEADTIYSEIKQLNKVEPLHPSDENFKKKIEKRIKYIQDCHKDFANAYPLVIRYMVEYGQYRTKALKNYLASVRARPWVDKEAFLKSQADYVGCLYREIHKHYNPKMIENLKRDVYYQLKKEDESFEKIKKETEIEVENKHKELQNKRKKELFEYILKRKELANRGELNEEQQKELDKVYEKLGILRFKFNQEYIFESPDLDVYREKVNNREVPNKIYSGFYGDREFSIEYQNAEITIIYCEKIYSQRNMDIKIMTHEEPTKYKLIVSKI